MANLEAIIAEKSQQDNQWRAEMQADRENTIAMQDAGVEEITSSPELYVKYLDMQGDNPTYSAGNIALVMFQDPEATVFGTAERWKTLNRGVIDQERSKGVKIFARNTLGRGYRLTDAYDIRQTQGRDLKKVQLKDDSKEMSIALRAILNYSVVPVATDHDLPVAAYYDSKNMELAVNPAFSDSEAFAAIAAEVAHSRIHAKGANPNYDHEEVDLDAQSISYILCRQFGIKRDTPDLSRLEELYEGWDPQQRRSALDQIQGMSKQFGGSIERNITPSREAASRPSARAGKAADRGRLPVGRLIRPPSPVKAGRLPCNRPRAAQSADWAGLDRGRPPDYAVSKGRTPQKPPDGGFCQCGERVRLSPPLRRRGAPFKSPLNLRGLLAPRFPVACFRSP
ncbi:MAG: hypothetical protein ACLRWQ_09015 [Flavonifractor plautii]